MKQIQVTASKDYCVTIGSGILRFAAERVRRVTKAQKVCIVSDSNVWPLYGETIRRNLLDNGIEVVHFVFSPGESSKNADIYLQLLHFLAANGLARTDCIVALGGGVVGDLAGFAAATYLRGIAYIQMPTTLLAMVDSSIGGKTGIDLPMGKNLVGAFYQPAAVLCDIDTLRTLPDAIFRDGCSEVTKYGVLYDAALFSHLEERGLEFDREAVISRCIELKRDVVALDEFDTGARMKLNLGHTIGHAIESCSRYAISHGQAVAAGMAIVSRSSKCPDGSRIISLLAKFGLPTSADYSAEELFSAAMADKKRSADNVNLIIPRAIGDCVIMPTETRELKTFIEEGL